VSGRPRPDAAAAGEPAVGIFSLHGKIQDYAWGSPTAIYELLGMPPTGAPAAEMWLGTHPVAPSEVSDASDAPGKAAAGGQGGRGRAGPLRRPAADVVGELPFLLKVLAADKALSLQVHPDIRAARAGFAAEQAARVPLGDPARRYRDANHKPELLVALTPFRALAGVREPQRSLAVVQGLGCPALVEAFTPLAQDPAGGAATVLRALLTLPRDRGRALAAAVTAAAASVPAGAADPDLARAAELVARLDAAHPGDVGIAAALLLHDVTLRPGEGLYQPARMLHAYVHGVGIEIMATSDNVLRGGLTPKHIDVDELLRILDPTPAEAPVRTPRTVARSEGGLVRTWDVPVGDFALAEAVCHGTVEIPAAVTPGIGMPTILLAVDGEVEASAGGATPLTLRRGRSALAVGVPSLTLAGGGRVFLASPGR
jgi:mannose-6-phosphate isomerase